MKKIFIVRLSNGIKSNPKTDKLIIRSSTPEKAALFAKKNSLVVTGRCFASVCEADPILDLGCMTRAQTLDMYEEMKPKK
jgi:hypothetical protein